jgi:hypothetical protein
MRRAKNQHAVTLSTDKATITTHAVAILAYRFMFALREVVHRRSGWQALYAKTPDKRNQQLRRIGKLASVCGQMMSERFTFAARQVH